MEFLKNKLIALTEYQFKETVEDYPASTYTIHFIYKIDEKRNTISSTADGDIHIFNFTNLDLLRSGEFPYTIVAEHKTTHEQETIDIGLFTVYPNLIQEGEPILYWQTVYLNLKEAFKKLSTREVESINVMGQTITYKELYKLIQMIDEAEKRMIEETKGKVNNKILVRFK